MDRRERYEALAAKGGASADEVLEFYDELPPVRVDELQGRWRGSELPTGHPMDGLLEACRWYGKEFIDAERVHPLLFSTSSGKVFRVDPRRIPMGLAARMPRGKALRWLFSAASPFLRTDRPKARLRRVEYRGKVSAAIIYDDLPILDAFRRVDASVLLGAMDFRGEARPFIFALMRE